MPYQQVAAMADNARPEAASGFFAVPKVIE